MSAVRVAKRYLARPIMPPRVASAAAVPVTRWVADNHRALLEFWNDGVSWTRAEVNGFIDRLARAS